MAYAARTSIRNFVGLSFGLWCCWCCAWECPDALRVLALCSVRPLLQPLCNAARHPPQPHNCVSVASHPPALPWMPPRGRRVVTALRRRGERRGLWALSCKAVVVWAQTGLCPSPGRSQCMGLCAIGGAGGLL